MPNLISGSCAAAHSQRTQSRCCAPHRALRAAGWYRNVLVHGIRRLHAMGVLTRRRGCDIETGDVSLQPSAGKHAPWPRFCPRSSLIFI
jgi:hypothetical protein